MLILTLIDLKYTTVPYDICLPAVFVLCWTERSPIFWERGMEYKAKGDQMGMKGQVPMDRESVK